ncbi:MAG: sigma-70 family RNA polymerase sigma factor [Roseivirga sp.]|nr:sigma-70 family RNA polymerase sigma factor [Roseivirga sp.]
MLQGVSDRDFERLIYENQSLIISVCNVYASTQADRDDLFQEITLNLWKGLASFKGKAKVSTWIYRVSLNTAISRVRKHKKSRVLYTEDVPEPAQSDLTDKGLESQFVALYRGINKLKPVERAIVLLYLEEKSYEEISEIMGITKSNVSVRLVRLKRKLEKMIKASEKEGIQ